jgi:hypothetical protein
LTHAGALPSTILNAARMLDRSAWSTLTGAPVGSIVAMSTVVVITGSLSFVLMVDVKS